MMELPHLTPIQPQFLSLLSDGCPIAQVWDKGEKIAFQCSILQSHDGKRLLLGLQQERTRAGRGLVEALWFDKTVRIYFQNRNETMCLTARPWKCHITGLIFREILEQFRQEHPDGDLAVVWELHPLTWESRAEQPPMPQSLELLSESESHLELLQPTQDTP